MAEEDIIIRIRQEELRRLYIIKKVVEGSINEGEDIEDKRFEQKASKETKRSQEPGARRKFKRVTPGF